MPHRARSAYTKPVLRMPANRYRFIPRLDLSPMAAWGLTYQAWRERVAVSTLIARILDQWGKEYPNRINPDDKADFLKSIPGYERFTRAPRPKEGDIG